MSMKQAKPKKGTAKVSKTKELQSPEVKKSQMQGKSIDKSSPTTKSSSAKSLTIEKSKTNLREGSNSPVITRSVSSVYNGLDRSKSKLSPDNKSKSTSALMSSRGKNEMNSFDNKNSLLREKSNKKLLAKSISSVSSSLKPGKSSKKLLKEGSTLSINTSKSSPSLRRLKSQYSRAGSSTFDSPTGSVKSMAKDESDFTNNTALFEKNLDTYRKFRVAVKETEDIIKNHHDRALKRVQERVMKESLESKLEVESRQLKEESMSIKQSFLLEADVAKEDQEQLKALKLYHQMQIKRLLPLWFKTLNDTTACIASNGHSEKLEWRSKSRKLLLLSLTEMDDDDSSEVVKAKVRYLALSINARKAQQVLNILKLIREEYIRHREGGSDLGHHSCELRRVKALLKPNQPPLERKQWSTDLESSIAHATERNESSLLHKSAYGSTVMSIDDEFTLESTEGGGFTLDDAHDSYEFSSMNDGQESSVEKSKDLFPRESRNKNASFMISTSSTPVDPHNNSEVMRLLRESSCQGLLAEAWRVFSHFYGDYINNVKDKTFVHMNLKCVPSLDTFKLLIMAFKNSESTQFDDISTIFILMKRANVEPDLETFNMILRACERRGAWRRALNYLKMMESVHGIVPNTNSFAIVIDSCRHAPETPTVIFDTLRNEKFPRKFCYQAAACNAGNRISTVAATDLFVDTFQDEPGVDIHTVGHLRRAVTAANVASSAFAPSKKWGDFNDKISKSLNWQSPAFHRTGPSVPAFQSQVLKIIAPQEALIRGNTNIKSGAVLGTSTASGMVGQHGSVDGASVGSAVTFDTFDESFASFKDLNKSFVRGVELEDSQYDASVASSSPKKGKTGDKKKNKDDELNKKKGEKLVR